MDISPNGRKLVAVNPTAGVGIERVGANKKKTIDASLIFSVSKSSLFVRSCIRFDK